MADRLKSGIPGLDEILGGGLPQNTVTIVSGPPGVGKSTLAMQFLVNGIKDYDESGIYLTVDETVEDVKRYAKGFGWDLDEYEKKKKLAIMGRPEFVNCDAYINSILEIQQEVGAERLILDSVTLFKYLFDRDDTSIRRPIQRFFRKVKDMGCTSMMTSEMTRGLESLEYTDEHFLSDGVIILFWSRFRAELERCLWVVKMREAEISAGIRPLHITSEGVSIVPDEVPFTLIKSTESEGQ